MDKKTRVPVREQDPAIRSRNFDEVSFGYDHKEALLEADRCVQCKNPRCVAACPVNIQIPQFIKAVLDGDMPGATSIIGKDSSLPAVCGRVCPQESQCEGACIMGIKHEPVAIGARDAVTVPDAGRGPGAGPQACKPCSLPATPRGSRELRNQTETRPSCHFGRF